MTSPSFILAATDLADIAIGAAVLILVEAGIWIAACYSLSRCATCGELTIDAPYRLLWRPKLITAFVALIVFTLSARYDRLGGHDLDLTALSLTLLALFMMLVTRESARAIHRYERSPSHSGWDY